MTGERRTFESLAWALCVAMSSCTVVPMEQRLPAPPVAGTAKDHVHEYIPYRWEPELVSMSDPVYPEDARAAHLSGTVLCHVFIDTTGVVTKADVLESVAPALNSAALAAARTALFRPALRQDKSKVATWMVVPVEFDAVDCAPSDTVAPWSVVLTWSRPKLDQVSIGRRYGPSTHATLIIDTGQEFAAKRRGCISRWDCRIHRFDILLSATTVADDSSKDSPCRLPVETSFQVELTPGTYAVKYDDCVAGFPSLGSFVVE